MKMGDLDLIFKDTEVRKIFMVQYLKKELRLDHHLYNEDAAYIGQDWGQRWVTLIYISRSQRSSLE